MADGIKEPTGANIMAASKDTGNAYQPAQARRTPELSGWLP